MTVSSLPAVGPAGPRAASLAEYALRGLIALGYLAGLYGVFHLYRQGSLLFALVWLGLLAALAIVYCNRRFSTARYLFPSLITVALFVFLPIVLTATLGFTNYSGRHLISQDRAQELILRSTVASDAAPLAFSLTAADGERVRLVLEDDGRYWMTEPFGLDRDPADAPTLRLTPAEAAPEPLPMRTVAQNRDLLGALEVYSEAGVRYKMASFREFAARVPRFEALGPGTLREIQSGELYVANEDTGFFANATGETLTPGFYVNVGFANYLRTLTDPDISEPFWAIFIWTVAFAGLTVLFTLFVGLPLACLVSMKELKGRGLYRVLLIVPYAVPAFISILVFRGLFNQSFGEVNLILESLFGLSPQWFDDPWLARALVLIVNTWLGYPYVMILSLGLLKTIPDDLYEASAIEGSGVLSNFFRITLPLVMKPLAPLLVASFAFNFNNFVIITLLTGGGPDFVDTTTPAGHTDLLVSYTYRIAFQDAGQNFALAAAVSMLIFALVGLLALINLRLARVKV